MGKVDLEAVLGVAQSVITSKAGQSLICGTYSDGKPRSVIDAWRDECISPKDRVKWEKKKRKKKKKKEKEKKKQKKSLGYDTGKKKKKKKTSYYF